MGHSSSMVERRSITPLYEACRDGNENLVRQLLPNYSTEDLNRQDFPYGGNTCLHVAAANGHDPIVKLLLDSGCFRSALLNSQNQSAYELAKKGKESTRLLFLRKSSTRFHDQNVTESFDFVEHNENVGFPERRRSNVQTCRAEVAKNHELEYSSSSKAVCQSRLGRFWVNRFHDDQPLDHQTIARRLGQMIQSVSSNDQSNDYVKAAELFEHYQKNYARIDRLIHLYTLETEFYRALQRDCLPLAIPLFIHLSELKDRFFRGRVYRGMLMTNEQFLIYQMATQKSGTLLQTRSFSPTSINRLVAEQFANVKIEKKCEKFPVLFIFDFLQQCDQAINLSRISVDQPALSEYEDEEEVLILPWTFFQVTRVRKANEDGDIATVHLTNVIIPRKNLFSTFKWSWDEVKNQVKKDGKINFNCAFQKYRGTKNR